MEAWDRLTARGDGWYWMVRGSRHGDLYHICSMARMFAAVHGRGLPIYLVADRAGQAAVASIFSDDFAEIIVDDSFPWDRGTWPELFAERKLPWFGPNTPLFLHPEMVLDPTRMTIAFAQENGLDWLQIYKNILRLPGDAEPAAPPAKLDVAIRARSLCREVGIVGGASAILFPYAQSLPVNSLDAFATLARDFARDGLRVFTSVSGEEAAVQGTSPVSIPFDLLIDVAEHAGRIVAVRSGICDVTSTARCRKTYVYPNAFELKSWSLSAMGFANDAREVVFDFAAGDGELFSATVMSSPGYSALAARPRHLSAFVGAHQPDAAVQAVSLAEALDGIELVPAQSGSALVIHGVAPRSHGRLHSAMNQLFAALVRRYGEHARLYACRDNGVMDFYEGLAADDLSVGRYLVAGFWHSVIITTGVPLAELLPLDARQKVVEPRPAAVDQPTRPGDALDGADGMTAVVRIRPLAINGLQFLSGWATLTRAGIWSDGPQAALKLVLEQPFGDRGGVLRLTLDATTFDEKAFSSIDVVVNDERLAIDWQRGEIVTAEVTLRPGRRVFHIYFLFAGLRSPRDRGTGDDPRLLGLGVIEAEVRAAPVPKRGDDDGPGESAGPDPMKVTSNDL